MADNESYRRRPISSFFSSPKLFTGFSAKGFSGMENQMSPTSILDPKPFSCLVKPLWYETKIPKTRPTESRRHWDKLDSKRIGLGIVDDLIDQSFRIVPFGSHLKIQKPSPKYTASKNSQTGSFSTESSLSPTKKSSFESPVSGQETPASRAFTEFPSVIKMELCEEYTCVISHGPNPTTTHIFDDCIVDSCKGPLYGSTKKTKNERHESFLRLCFTCKKSLEKGRDIYMYRGEQAFCSEECRYQEMIKGEMEQ